MVETKKLELAWGADVTVGSGHKSNWLFLMGCVRLDLSVGDNLKGTTPSFCELSQLWSKLEGLARRHVSWGKRSDFSTFHISLYMFELLD